MTSAQASIILQHVRRLAGKGRAAQTPDRLLLERFTATRDEAAFADLVRLHGPMVLNVCRSVLHHEQDAEDAFQATFLVLARKAASIRQPEAVAGWLYEVAYHVAVKAHADAARRRAQERRIPPMAPADPTLDMTLRDLRRVLHEELQRLPDKYRLPLVLCYLEGRSHEEAADQLGWSKGTFRGRLDRGRERLRRRLEARGVALSALLGTLSVASRADALALLEPAVRAALLSSSGGAAAGALSARVVALAEGVIPTLFTGKFKVVTAVLLAASLVATGAGVVAHQTRAAREQPVENQNPEVRSQQPGPAAAKQAPKPPAEPEAKKEDANAQAPADDDGMKQMTLRGRVLDPDGKPLAGARLYVSKVNQREAISSKGLLLAKVGETQADGRFQATFRIPVLLEAAYVVAHAPDYGVDWVDCSTEPLSGDVTFHLVKDVPITGRVLNTEGKPMAGVSVSAASIYVPDNEKLDDFLAAWLRDPLDSLQGQRKFMVLTSFESVTGTVRTDQEGRFNLHGAGAERIVPLLISGGGVARSMTYIITRQGFDPKPYNDELRKNEYDFLRVQNRFAGLYPPALAFVAEPGKTVEGIVRDAATGEPLPGVLLSAFTTYGDSTYTLSGADGSYRLEGLAKKAAGYDVHVYGRAPRASAHLKRSAHAPDTEGYSPVKLDIGLVKGAVVTGRAVDRQTGKGVPATIRFAPLPDNPFFGSKPGYDNYSHDRSVEAGTDAEGRFQAATIPGKALVMAGVVGGEKVNGAPLCPYRTAVPDPDFKGLFQHDNNEGSWSVATAGSIEFLRNENAVKVIDVKQEGETRVELFVDRGASARLAVQDTDGKPLAGAWVAGLTALWPITYKLPEATATVFALNPEEPRTLALFHADRQLGGTVTIRGDEKEPVVAKLAPAGKVVGRFVEVDGAPLVGAEVSVFAQNEIGRELYRFAHPTGKAAVTDKDGRFTLSGVVPGVVFGLQVQKEGQYFSGKPKIGRRQLKPGETLDLGDRTVEAQR